MKSVLEIGTLVHATASPQYSLKLSGVVVSVLIPETRMAPIWVSTPVLMFMIHAPHHWPPAESDSSLHTR